MNNTQNAGMYLHIPFCEGKCPYCDFYSLAADQAAKNRYTDSLIRALDAMPPDEGLFDTLYFGGGTPNLMGSARLSRLVKAALATGHWAEDPEITLEANPNLLTRDELSAYVKAGFNRISIGVQSTHDNELHMLGRRHSHEQSLQAIRWAAAAGFRHIACDLMIGLPGQSTESVLQSIEKLSNEPIDHLSVYLLKREENTPFYTRYPDADADEMADLYLSAVAVIERQGFKQYEISNFARPGGESRHNLKYWSLAPYVGLGPSAHSFMHGRRAFFPRDIEGFMAAPNPFDLWQDDGPGGDFREYVMLGLRLTHGIAMNSETAANPDMTAIIARTKPLVDSGYATFDSTRLALTPRGFLISNSIIAYLLN